MNSLNIHDILEIEIKTKVLDSDLKPFTVIKYKFTDTDGNEFIVNAFLKKERD